MSLSKKKRIFRDVSITISCGHRLLPPKGYFGIMLFGRVWTRASWDEMRRYLATPGGAVFMHHEIIHVIQARSMGGWLMFYILYIWYWIKLFIRKRNARAAYYAHPFEQEAYEHQAESTYNQSRWRDYVARLDGKNK